MASAGPTQERLTSVDFSHREPASSPARLGGRCRWPSVVVVCRRGHVAGSGQSLQHLHTLARPRCRRRAPAGREGWLAEASRKSCAVHARLAPLLEALRKIRGPGWSAPLVQDGPGHGGPPRSRPSTLAEIGEVTWASPSPAPKSCSRSLCSRRESATTAPSSDPSLLRCCCYAALALVCTPWRTPTQTWPPSTMLVLPATRSPASRGQRGAAPNRPSAQPAKPPSRRIIILSTHCFFPEPIACCPQTPSPPFLPGSKSDHPQARVQFISGGLSRLTFAPSHPYQNQLHDRKHDSGPRLVTITIRCPPPSFCFLHRVTTP